ncbi:MAG: 3-hydroxyacyl-CoA dehydrogenase NAD-binding domain-containing protein [Candidatus Puniceispirillaceae bacterium]
MSKELQKIAVIGSGTMGSAIAGQIANAGMNVLLLDLPSDGDNVNQVAQSAIDRLLKSDPPALMHKKRSALISVGNIRDDFETLADYDWIIEAVVERLDIKKDLYQRLNETTKSDCIITSNTSTIPIKLLVEDMPASFQQRFAITHYFNPVRYMRLLELVRGDHTSDEVIDLLADFNDRILGKGVVACNDTPGFLGNRVGVYALQVGLNEAARHNLSVEDADALMGRPMGIPKTGVFGLYDLIGIDLMADVVDTLATILPENDAFHAVGQQHNPVQPLIKKMIADGYTGDKGLGGFYRLDEAETEWAVSLADGTLSLRKTNLCRKAALAAEMQARNLDPLPMLISRDDDTSEEEHAQTNFIRSALAHILQYAASLIPDVTQTPQQIDDAMKLGFNWIKGPFEMMDALGHEAVRELIEEAGLSVPPSLSGDEAFYRAENDVLLVAQFSKEASRVDDAPVQLPDGTMRFHMMRQCLTPICQNESASLFAIGDDLRLIEFHSKANALTDQSMKIVKEAADDHGRGIIVHNDAQHFSAGVDLNAFRALIDAENWSGIDAFLDRFQQAVKALKYTNVPVIGAPSGLAIGGGFEVLAHCDKIIAHANSVLGLVESGVGVVPAGGGVKESYWRWYQATNDWRKAAWQTWMQIGYGLTGTSPETSARYHYYRDGHDDMVMNRDKLIMQAMTGIEAMISDGYMPPAAPKFTLAPYELRHEMADFMDKGIADGLFFAHDKVVAMQIATIVTADEHEDVIEVGEDDLYARERRAFINLAKTTSTKERIVTMLDKGAPVRN